MPARRAFSLDAERDAPDSCSDDEQVPIFGTWRAIYAAVIAAALVVMALIALFSYWEY